MNNIVGTREAFKWLISQPAINKKLGLSRSTVSNYKRYLEAGQSISTDKMEELLLKAGAVVKKDKVWMVK